MKHENWAYKYGPPPDELPENDHGWPQSWLMIAFVIVGPLIYFGPGWRMIEAWLIGGYQKIELWILPLGDWLLG